MKSQKDTQQLTLSSEKNNLFYVASDKDTGLATSIASLKHMQKIMRAVYMVTDLCDSKETLVLAVRNAAAEVVVTLTNNLAQDNKALAHNQLSSLIYSFEVFADYHNVSSMNHRIVSGEMLKLAHTLAEELKINNSATQEMSVESCFEADAVKQLSTPVSKETAVEKASPKKTFQKDAILYTTKETNGEVKKDTVTSTPSKAKATGSKTVSGKKERHENILNILDEKGKLSINDICLSFDNCSSKTIQRDLAELIKNKKVVKRGDRRWSTYSLT